MTHNESIGTGREVFQSTIKKSTINDSLLLPRHPVNHSAGIVAHVHRSLRTHNDPYWPSHPHAFARLPRLEPAGNEILYALRFTLAVQLYPDDLVYLGYDAVTRSVRGNKENAAVLRRKH